jgi:hypothetical protein
VPEAEVALAVMVCGVLTGRTPPAAGLVIATTAGGVVTVTFTAVDTDVVPRLSTARAVKVVGPPVVGIHVIEYGAVVIGLPMGVPLARNCTLATVAPAATATAVALTVVGVPMTIVLPALGEVTVTVGPGTATTLNETAGDVVVPP